MKRRPVNPGLPAVAAGALLVLVAGGCYNRVVGVEGVGTSNYTIHEANLKEDRGVFGFGAGEPESQKLPSPKYEK